jgi:hypothetical protein
LQSTAGTVSGDIYTSAGRPDPNVQLVATGQDLTYCYSYSVGTCQPEQIAMLANGTAEICNWIVVDANSTQLFPDVIARCRAEWGGGGPPASGNQTYTPLPTGSIVSPGPTGAASTPLAYDGGASTLLGDRKIGWVGLGYAIFWWL